jgi:Ca-activated chloride channel family protein
MKSEKTPPSNLVFLMDVSGSMGPPNKLPLLKSSFRLLVEQLGEKDRVAIVVYAGAAGLVLPSTPGYQKEKILAAIDKLEAGGSTAGGEGIKLAYKVAEENFIKKGNNRIILATDGDFNIGVSSTSELVRMIEEKRKNGVFFTTLGFGMGNYKDHRLEQLADKGNGSYHYIDNILEGKKVFVHDMRGTLFTIAKDVKIQVEFNPAKVESYRLIGYENRKLQKEDFDDDKKDAGELGSGHTVTALYEIVPAAPGKKAVESSSLRFQESRIKADAFKTSEFALVKLRYKKPDGIKSNLITRAVVWKEGNGKGSVNSRFSAAVALFGMLLRESEYAGKATFNDVSALAKGAVGNDQRGYRSEFLRLVDIAQALKN